jgi:hypothetical protein
MARFGVGVMHNTINSRFGPKPLVHADYAIGNAGAIQPSLRKSATRPRLRQRRARAEKAVR